MNTFNFRINLGLRGGKYLLKSFLTSKSRSEYLKYQISQISINCEHFSFYNQFLGQAISTYLIKIIFYIKIEIDIFEISNFNKFWALFILGSLSAEEVNYLLKITFDIKFEIRVLKIWNVPSFIKFWEVLILGPIWV